MDDIYTLPVSYRGEELEFPLRVVAGRYGLRYLVNLDGVELVFERDDAGELRGIIYNPDETPGKLPEPALIEAVGAVIQQLVS